MEYDTVAVAKVITPKNNSLEWVIIIIGNFSLCKVMSFENTMHYKVAILT
jgi:hypothetical protein